MRVLPLLIVIASILPAASADEFKSLSLPLPALIQQLSKEPLAAIPVPSRNASMDTLGDTALYWTYEYKELFTKGAAIFEYKKQRYAIKLMFRKGRMYDSKEGIYISAAWVYIINITNVDKAAPVQTYLDPRNITAYPVPTTSGDTMKIKNDAKTLSIISQGGLFGGLFEKTIFSIRYDQLFKLWSDNAENYKRTVHGKTIYLVPQMNKSAIGLTQVGFVASENKPLSDSAGYPLDFIALCQTVTDTTCRTMRHSIPLGLKFRHLGEKGTNEDKDFFYWQIEEMVKEDLYDALDDEALEGSINP